jgi:hypothetical protein
MQSIAQRGTQESQCEAIWQIPNWQIQLGKLEMDNLLLGNTDLIEWEMAKLDFTF